MVISLQDICQVATAKVRIAKTEEYRQKNPKTIVLFHTGNYYLSYEDSARDLVNDTFCVLTTENGIVKTMFSNKQSSTIFPHMVRQGYKFAIFEHEL